ncbi:8-oxo-dGTP diphosphatase [Erysipelothrix sp. HDW6C]|uniref:8-oxo-dGTP diphosphatase n=1 Tax=Erysipelothrix sp. HDW6C TaxID=2714930 RepID=UPI001407B99E|nr:8-oxo-dGTP diphosphatase [Erysipelothrix sp. HDW6C]QIK70622.1 8-oxo-dGTP diphosphatase [Erysipelothrix sp. HDW6C]
MGTTNYRFWNIVVVVKDQKILLIDRNKGDFDGLVAPGGKVDFPETFYESAQRELLEETGLHAKDLILKGMSGYINSEKNEQYLYYDYFCDDFTGTLVCDGPEGQCDWYDLGEIETLPIPQDMKARIQLMLKHDSYEYQMYWDEKKNQVERIQIYADGKPVL